MVGEDLYYLLTMRTPELSFTQYNLTKDKTPMIDPNIGYIMELSTPDAINSMMTNKPYGSSLAKLKANAFGKTLIAIRPPSKGGTGIKFNTISTKLIKIPPLAISSNGELK